MKSANLQESENIIDIEPEEIQAEEVNTFYQIFKNISSLSIPMALSYTFSFEVFLTTIMLALANPDDEKDIAATTLIATLMNTMIILGLSPLFGISILASKKIGELKKAESNNVDEDQLQEMRDYIAGYNRNALLMSLCIMPPVVASLYFSKSLLTDVFQQDAATSEIAQNFLRPYSFAVPGILARMCFEQIMFSFGRPKPAMIMGLASLATGTALSAALGFGDFGAKKFGSKGIAFGYVAEAYVTTLLYGLYIAAHKDFNKFHFFNLFKRVEKSASQLKEMLAMAGPISFSVANELAMSLSMGILAGLVGTKEQAALTSAMQCVFFSFIPLAAFGQACSQEVSREIGAKHYQNSSRIGKFGLLTTMGYMIPFPLACAIEPRLLTLAVGGNQENTLQILKYLMPMISAGVIFDSARYNVLQQLRSLGDMKGSTIISVGGLSAGVVVAGLLGLKTQAGIYGVAAGYTGGIMLSGAGLMLRWLKRIEPMHIKEVNEPVAAKISHAKNSPRFFAVISKKNDLSEALITKEDQAVFDIRRVK
jgi:multidrug resistance protein, MATE family